jgi:transcriptional regulator with XRE-family HTH domain
MPATSTIGDRARAERSRLGLNQSEIAERVGISIEVYGRFERGLVTPRLATLMRLCDVLGVEPNDLLLDRAKPRNAASEGPPAKIRQLAALLEDADDITIKRVTEVARWLKGRKPVRAPSRVPRTIPKRKPRRRRT